MILQRFLVISVFLICVIKSSFAVILQREDNITKSLNDKRAYRTLELANHMKVVLVSDSEVEKSAVCLRLAVGSLSDPKEIQGLAHFTEHMIFMGTKKYPDENTFQKFINDHGGDYDAATDSDCTHYFFKIPSDYFKECLDIFLQFFLDPLFRQSTIDREANAVNLENEGYIPDDTRRTLRLVTHLADPEHAFNSFSTGNIDTLLKTPMKNGLNIRKALLQFYNKWYSSNLMTLALLGPESLDELEKIATDFFGQVKDKQVEQPRWTKHPYRSDQFQTFLYKSPVKDVRTLEIFFPGDDLSKEYRSKPFYYINFLLGDEGPNSISSVLKNRNWATSLSAEEIDFGRGFNFFYISMDLTKDGLNHINEIVKLVFQYVNMLKKKGIQKWVQDEISHIQEIRFRFKERETLSSYVVDLTKRLNIYGAKDILSAENLITDWKPDLIKKELNYLIPQNIRILITSKDFEEDLEEEEPFYKIRYKLTKIPKDVIKDWNNAGFSSELDLPLKNDFIATDFNLLPIEKPIEKYPKVIKDTTLSRVWFKQDDTFLVPKVDAYFLLQSPITSIDPINTNLAAIFQDLFYNSLFCHIYSGELADLQLTFHNSEKGFVIHVSGYNNKQPIFLDKFMENLVNFTIDPEKFQISKEKQLRDLRNVEANEPSDQVFEYITDVLNETRWTTEDLLEVYDEIKIEKMQEFILQFFSKIHIECLIHGNVNQAKALELVKIVEDRLTSSFNQTKMLPRELQLAREVKLRKKHSYIYEVENKVHTSSCVALYFQVGLRFIESYMKLKILQHIMDEPAFHTLRTKEQLGYVVSTSLLTSNTVQGLVIVVQSDRHPKYLDQRIEAFLKQINQTLFNMPEEEFMKHREALIKQRLVKPQELKSQSSTYWSEIETQEYFFNSANEEIDCLMKITKQDILVFFEKHIAESGTDRRKLAIYINSVAKGRKLKNEDQLLINQSENGSDIIKINNLVDFKRSHELYPIILPKN